MDTYHELAFQILERLIAIDTTNPPGNERAAAEYLAELLGGYGITCQVQPTPNAGGANLVGQIGTGAPSLLFDGHLDVVPASGGWTMPPFALTRKDRRLYGRGSCDMKGGIAAMCAAAICLVQSGEPKRGELRLLFSADEECANTGLHAYQSAFPPSDYAVIGEPTELCVAVAHRGVSRNFIDVTGAARHAALPADGDDSIARLAKLIESLHRLNAELQSGKHEVLPPPSVAVTMVQGYEKENVIPARVRVMTDFRVLPGMTADDVHAALDACARQGGVGEYEIIDHFFMGGGEIAVDDGFVQLCCEAGGAALGRALSPVAFDASCEQGFIVRRGTKAIICGPGSLQQAHTADEYLEEEELYRAVDCYTAIARAVLR